MLFDVKNLTCGCDVDGGAEGTIDVVVTEFASFVVAFVEAV